MNIDIQHGPAYALAVVHLQPGETVVAEGGAMVSMDTHVKMETTTKKKEGQGLLGGLMSGLKRMVAGESFFQNHFTAEGSAGEVTFAPTHCGDVVQCDLAGNTMVLQSTAYLCSGKDVEIDAKWGGAKSFFGGEGLIMLKASGTGPLVFNSFGGIREIDVEGEYIVDTGHIVAFEDSLTFKVTRFGGGIKAFIFGGEGLVCRFSGTGKLWIQTRNPQGFGELIGGKLPPRA
ncbi:MAG: TIGR00266 family protein [Deltaproteobacteria bacterium]|nr:MAG: TIGR00266 family protein [Deltaproteobacteria bacterium]